MYSTGISYFNLFCVLYGWWGAFEDWCFPVTRKVMLSSFSSRLSFVLAAILLGSALLLAKKMAPWCSGLSGAKEAVEAMKAPSKKNAKTMPALAFTEPLSRVVLREAVEIFFDPKHAEPKHWEKLKEGLMKKFTAPGR